MTLVTADDFLALGESDEHMELIEGEIVVHPRPTFGHQAITLNVAVALRRWTDETPCRGYANIRVDHHIDDRNVYAPDVWWVQDGQVPTNDAASESVLVYRRSTPTAAEFDVELEFFRCEMLTSPQLPGFELDISLMFDS